MAVIIVDFVLCHYCNKKYKPDDPEMDNHWRECPNSPQKKIIDDLLAACKLILNAEKGNVIDLYAAIDAAKAAIAKAEGSNE